MLKLYKTSDEFSLYWETWEDDGVHTVHWGTLGTTGQSKEVRSTPQLDATAAVEQEARAQVGEGFAEIDIDDHAVLLIEYPVAGHGTAADVEKRHRLQARMNETLGWTGLGHCDGGSIGSGTMEVCCLVVDFETAKRVIAADLKGTEFSDYARIFDEGA